MNDGLTCPKCGTDCLAAHTALDGWDDCLGFGNVFVDFTCPNCKTEFTNVYTFNGQEITYTEEEA